LASAQKYRMTTQREVILEVVKKSHSHPTADEIYEEVRKVMPRVSLGTVYRNLDILATCGMITRLDPGRTQMRFDGNVQEHYHLTCVRCGRIEDLPMGPSEDPTEIIEGALGKLTKYGVFGHRLEFIGLCSQCQKAGYRFPEDFSVQSREQGGTK